MTERKHVVIQKRIDEAIDNEISRFFQSTENNPLVRLIITGKSDSMSLEEIKKIIGENENAS